MIPLWQSRIIQPPATARKADLPAQTVATPAIDTKAAERELHDARGIQSAKDLITSLPGPGVSRHVVIAARKTDFFNVIPAIVELARPAKVDELWLATLGFNQHNCDRLFEMLDAGDVGKCFFTASAFFEEDRQAGEMIVRLREELPKRGGWYHSTRSHMKLVNFRLSDGRAFVTESSANLRTCSTAEAFTITQDAKLFAFYTSILYDFRKQDMERSDHKEANAANEPNLFTGAETRT